MAATQNITFFVGESITIACSLNPIVDITAWTLQFTVRKQLGLLPVLITKTTGAGITIVSGPAGTYTVTIDSADTANLAAGDYLYDIQRTGVGTHRVLNVGTLTLTAPVAIITPP